MQPQRLVSYSLNELIINLCENGHSLLLLRNSRIGRECISHLKADVSKLCVIRPSSTASQTDLSVLIESRKV